MVMTDPIADMLTRIRNANQMRHEVVEMPASKMKREVLELLNQDKYIFATKIEEKEADIDSSQLLKMIKSEVQDSIRRTGKNPLCM